MNILELSGKRYEVRAKCHDPQIKIDGEWVGVYGFINYLQDNQDWKAIEDLALYGQKHLKTPQNNERTA